MVQWNQPGRGYDSLTPAQRIQADAIFKGDRMRQHTYAVGADGNVEQWRYYIPSEFCKEAIRLVMTGK